MKESFLLIMCLLTLLVACGKREGAISAAQRQAEEPPQEMEGMYQAKIIPVNLETAGSTVGVFRILIQGDDVRIRGDISNSPTVTHQQRIQRGKNCPGPESDSDLDGEISLEESIKITGETLFYISSANPDPQGNYLYSTVISLTEILTRLPSDEDLNLSGRVLMIYGAEGNPNLPIACGVIERQY